MNTIPLYQLGIMWYRITWGACRSSGFTGMLWWAFANVDIKVGVFQWCPPCRALLPELRKASVQLHGQMKFGTLDCTIHEALCNMVSSNTSHLLGCWLILVFYGFERLLRCTVCCTNPAFILVIVHTLCTCMTQSLELELNTISAFCRYPDQVNDVRIKAMVDLELKQ